MADFDADDFDIDELLDELDSSGTKGKDGKAAGEADKKTPGTAGASGGNKSVRFSDNNADENAGGDTSNKGEDDFISKLPRSQREPPAASLRTMFFADKPASSAGQSSPSTKSATTTARPQSGQTSRGRSSGGGSGGASVSSSDWLGIQEGKANRSRSPSNSPPPTTQRSKSHPSRGSSGERNKSGNSSEEENALFQDIGISRQSRRSASKPSVPHTPSQPDSKPPQTTPRSRPGTAGESSNPGPSFPSKPTFSSSYLDQLGMNSPTDSPKTSLDLSKPSFGPSSTLSKQIQHQPLPSTASLLGTSVPPPMTIPPAQESPNFPLMKPPAADTFPSFSLTAPSVVPQPPQEKNSTGPQKKKALKKDNPGGGGNVIPSVSSTLQLPIHLINEDELKAMSSSLKTLYANQLDMLEKSYKEQMNFLNAANHRKEELLKDEMKGMQMDYEERMERLRNEIRELENSKTSQFKASLQPQDLEILQNLSEKLNTTLATLQETIGKSASTNEESSVQIQKSIEANLDKNLQKMEGMEEKIYGMVKSLDGSITKSFGLMNEAWKNLLGQIKNNMGEIMDTARKANVNIDGKCHAEIENDLARLEGNITESLVRIGKSMDETGGNNNAKVISKLNETEKIVLAELAKLLKLQRKAKEHTDGITLEPIVKVLESDRDDDQRRRERLAQNIKEMRKEIKRMSMETEMKQESLQKFSMSTEVELRSISQSIRDLNSQLKFSIISGPDTMTNQFNASMQQTQSEMEMKLLREERQALSDTMAQVNVEKRKLSEDRVELEKQKLDFQKDKDRIKNLEIQLKTKIDETEAMQKKTESVRKEELQITAEAQVKLKDLEREKGIMRDKLMEAEHKLRAWEQKLRQEKLELVRERQFIDKLRDQLLCPSCMKQNDAAGVLHPPPPPYISNEPGFLGNSNFTDDYINSRINAMGGTGGGAGDTNELFDIYYRRYFD